DGAHKVVGEGRARCHPHKTAARQNAGGRAALRYPGRATSWHAPTILRLGRRFRHAQLANEISFMALTFPGLQDPARWHSRGQPEAVPGIQEKTCQRPS